MSTTVTPLATASLAYVDKPPWTVPNGKYRSQANEEWLRLYCADLHLDTTGMDGSAMRHVLAAWIEANKAARPKKTPAPRRRKAKATPPLPSPLPSNSTTRRPQPPPSASNEASAEQVEQLATALLGMDASEQPCIDRMDGSALMSFVQALPADEGGPMANAALEIEDELEEPGAAPPPSKGFKPPCDVAKLMRYESAFYDEENADVTPEQRHLAETQAEIAAGRRKTAWKTEISVVKELAPWIYSSIENSELKDDIVDTHCAIMYLRFASTGPLKNTNGKMKEGVTFLSSNSLKKIKTMLHRVRDSQVTAARERGVDLDITRPYDHGRIKSWVRYLQDQASQLARSSGQRDVLDGTMLEYGRWTSETIRSLIAYTLKDHAGSKQPARMDDLLSTMLCGVQPWHFHPHKGMDKPIFCLVVLRRDGKMLSSRAFEVNQIHLHPVGDDDVWDWERDETWRQACLLPGHSINKPLSSSTLANGVGRALEGVGVRSRNKGHLGRKAGAVVMDQNGASASSIMHHGGWAGGTFQDVYASKLDRNGVHASAGFVIGERMVNPRLNIAVPPALVAPIFAWVTAELAKTKLSRGTRLFLELLLELRKFLVLHFAAVAQIAPDNTLFRNLPLFKGEEGLELKRWCVEEYPQLLSMAEAEARKIEEHLQKVQLEGVRDALGGIYRAVTRGHEEQDARWTTLDRRTAQFSPSKRRRLEFDEDDVATSSAVSPPHPHLSHPYSPIPALPVPPPEFLPPAPVPLGASALPLNFRPSSPNPSFPPSPSLANSSTHPMPATPPRRAQCTTSLNDEALISPNRLRLSPTAPTAWDFLLPHTLDAFAAEGQQAPALDVFQRGFAPGGGWTAILDAVKRPQLLWDTYKPRLLSQYPSVYSLWEHWGQGSAGNGREGPGRLPPISLLESRFGVKWRSAIALPGQSADEVNQRRRTHMCAFKRITSAVQAALTARGPGADVRSVIDGLLHSHGELAPEKVNALSEALQKKKAPKPASETVQIS